jgi:betaine-aldehyde dehydrogenase
MMQAQPQASHFVNGAYLEDVTGAAMPVIFPGTGETSPRYMRPRPP